MTERTQYRDNETDQWTTREANQADPHDVTAVTITTPDPDRLDVVLAELTALVDSEPMVTIAVAGESEMGTSPVAVAETVLRRIRARLEGETDGV